MKPKCALIVYHANAEKIYLPHWIEQFKNSILNQTYKDFDIWEFNYDGGDYRIFENSSFASMEFPTFVHCLNYLLDKLFEVGYDCICNSNADDYFAVNRIEKQLEYINAGYDLVSSNFSLIRDDATILTHRFHNLDIQAQLDLNHNILCHPSCCYSKAFWERNRYIPEELPLEDLRLWQRAIKNSKFIILEDVLCFHRLHSNSVCQSENR